MNESKSEIGKLRKGGGGGESENVGEELHIENWNQKSENAWNG